MAFEVGKTYSRHEISAQLGGSVVSYLPEKNGVVVCGCFKREPRWNPRAPEEVTFGGPAPRVLRAAEIVATQNMPIPIFLYRRDGAWEYVGDYVCTGLNTDREFCATKERENPARGKICGVLTFKIWLTSTPKEKMISAFFKQNRQE